MKEKLIILTIVIYLFNLFFVHGQTMVGNFDPHEYYAMTDTLPRPYESIPQYRLKADNVGEWLYEREELNKPPIDAYQPLQIELVPTFGGNSVTKTLEYESGIMAELKIAVHNMDTVTRSFPYYFAANIGWSNISLEHKPKRFRYDFITYGIDAGMTYHYFLIYASVNRHRNVNLGKMRSFSTFGVGGGVRLPIVNSKISVNMNGELNKVFSGSPFLDWSDNQWYSNLTVGIGIKIF